MQVEFEYYTDATKTIPIASLTAKYSANEISVMDINSDKVVNATEWYNFKSIKNTFLRISESELTFNFAQGLKNNLSQWYLEFLD
jgi:hypothetical protein